MNFKTQMEKIINRSYKNIAGLIVQKNGNIEYEKYYNNCTEKSTIHVASVTKSVVSALFGIAIAEGYIDSIEKKVLDFFPAYTPVKGENTIQQITIKDMLTMTAPYKCKTEPYVKYFTSENWINEGLNLLGGNSYSKGEFTYSPIVGTHLLSGILVKATGQSVLDYATKKLFIPLEITPLHNISLKDKEEHIAFGKSTSASGWAVDPQGINTAGWGLTLTAQDMTKIGQLYLNKGVWQDKELIPQAWIYESTATHSICKQWGNLKYGYLWWIMDEKERAYAAMGDGGNVIYVNEAKNIVVSIASLAMQNATDRIKLIKDYIEPVFC